MRRIEDDACNRTLTIDGVAVTVAEHPSSVPSRRVWHHQQKIILDGRRTHVQVYIRQEPTDREAKRLFERATRTAKHASREES